MKVLFVCTGNICRSPMGEYLFPLFFNASDIEMDSAGTNGLIDSPIDPSSGKLLAQDGIDASEFRSKRLTPQLARSADLILCFSKHQRAKIVQQNPTVGKNTLMLSDFANMCDYCTTHDLVEGDTIKERLQSVLNQASLIRPSLGVAEDIADPYRKDFSAFETAHNEIVDALGKVAKAIDIKGMHAAAEK